MGILSDAEADPIKLALEIALPDRCAILRKGSPSVNATTGGWTEGESTYASNIPCRVDTRGMQTPIERPVSGRVSAVGLFNVVLSTHSSRWPGGTVDVRPTDIFVVTGEGAGRYEIVDAGGPVTDDLVRTVPATRIS